MLLEVNKILIFFYVPAGRNTGKFYLTAQFLFQQKLLIFLEINKYKKNKNKFDKIGKFLFPHKYFLSRRCNWLKWANFMLD